MYYLRTQPAVNAIQFTVDKSKLTSTVDSPKKGKENMSPMKSPLKDRNNNAEPEFVGAVCRMEEGCLMCGS